MAKDKRYVTAKNLIQAGYIKSLSDLLGTVDKTPLSRDIKTSPERFNKLLVNPALFMFQDAYNMAQVIGVDEKIILDLIHAEWLSMSRKRR